jgi:uncharacterized membrane protein YeiH
VPPSTLASFVEILAVLASALSGMITASRKHMDFVGTYVLAIVTAFGGGTLRDVLLVRRPLFWVSRWEYLAVVLALCIPFVYSRRVYESASRWQKRFSVIDALGLGLFGVTGVLTATAEGMPIFVASLYGVITATFGGVLRDIMVAEIPLLFRPGGLYATSVFVGVWVLLALRQLDIPAPVAAVAGFTVILALRLAAIWFGATLPAPHWLRELQETGEFPSQGR